MGAAAIKNRWNRSIPNIYVCKEGLLVTRRSIPIMSLPKPDKVKTASLGIRGRGISPRRAMGVNDSMSYWCFCCVTYILLGCQPMLMFGILRKNILLQNIRSNMFSPSSYFRVTGDLDPITWAELLSHHLNIDRGYTDLSISFSWGGGKMRKFFFNYCLFICFSV